MYKNEQLKGWYIGGFFFYLFYRDLWMLIIGEKQTLKQKDRLKGTQLFSDKGIENHFMWHTP